MHIFTYFNIQIPFDMLTLSLICKIKVFCIFRYSSIRITILSMTGITFFDYPCPDLEPPPGPQYKFQIRACYTKAIQNRV